MGRWVLSAFLLATALGSPAAAAPSSPLFAKSGETLALDTFDLPPGASVTIEFEVTIDNPVTGGATQVCNQGQALSDDFLGSPLAPVASDDPDTAAPADATCTQLLLQADLMVTKGDSVDPVVAGNNLTYTITVANAGPSAANDVVVNDTLPGGVMLVSTTGCAEDPAGAPTCSLGTILKDGSKQYTITVSVPANATGALSNTAMVSSSTTLINTGDDSATEPTAIVSQADLTVSKTDAVDPVIAGNNLTYTVTVDNNGPSDAENVVVTDTLPGGVTLVSTTGCSEDPSGAPTCTLGTIAAGGSKQYTIVVSVPADASGSLSNTAAVASTTPLINTSDDSDTEATAIAAEADLTVTKTDSVDPVTAGNNLTYTVTVDNAGPSDAQGVTVTDTLPGAVTLVSTTGCSEDPSGAPTCTLGTIAAGGSKQYTIVVSVPANATGSLSNTAAVSSSTTLINTSDDSDTETTAIAAEADLTVTKTDSVDPVIAGNNLTYTVTVDNAGPSDAQGVTVMDTLPGAVTLVSTTGCAEDPSAVPTCTLGTITAGGSKQYTIVVSVPASATGSLSNTAAASSSTTLINTSDDSDTEATAIAAEADLTVTKTDSVDPVIAGNNLTYTVTVANAGPSDAQGVTVMDTLPGAVTLVSTTGCAEDPSGAPTCTLGTIAAGGSKQYTIVVSVPASATGSLSNTAAASSSTTLINTSDDSDTEATAISTEADLTVTKTDSVDPVIAGNNLTYTVTVANAGPSDAQGVTVMDTLPGAVTLVSTTGCAEDPSGAPTCTLGTIAAGGSKQYTIVVSVPASATGSLSNTAAASSSTTLINTGDDSDTETTAIAAEADLKVTKTDSVDPVIAGNNLTYTVTVDNAGPSDAQGVTVMDTLPGAVTLVSTTGCAEDPSGAPTCTLGTIAAGGSKQYTIVVSVSPTAGGSLSNTAAVSSSTTLVNTGDDSATETTAVVSETDLAITKTAVPPSGALTAGQPLTYTITVTNDGPSTATGVVVTDVLPAGLIFQTTAGDCAEGAAAVPTCTLGTLAPGASKGFTIDVVVDSPAPTSVTNTATVAGNETDPVPGNNSDDVTHSADNVPPEVVAVDTVPGDGALVACETVRTYVRRLKVTFSEAMRVSGGIPGSDDADNPDNYLLVGTGPDFDFSTDFCGLPQGDDVAIPITAVDYAADTPAPPQSTVTLRLANALPDGLYRFFACGSTSLKDAAGNTLDGDGNGEGGDDYVLDLFRVDARNLFANGHFDCVLAPWLEDPPAAAGHDPAADADGSPLSGSASVPLTAAGEVTLDQCVSFAAFAPGTRFELGGRFRLDTPATTVLGLMAACELRGAAACGGAVVGSAANADLISGAAGVWGASRPLVLVLPPGAASGRCGLSFENPLGLPFTAYLDQLYLKRPAAIFADGFESGDTSAWSVTVP